MTERDTSSLTPDVLKHLDELEAVLRAHLAAMTALHLWQPRKIGYLKKHQLAEIEAFNRQEEEQVARIMQSESRRQVLMTVIQQELGLLGEGELQLTSLVGRLPVERAERLSQLRDRLLVVTAELKESQGRVAELLRISMAFVHHSMDVFAQLAQVVPATGYGEGGSVSAGALSSYLLDRRA